MISTSYFTNAPKSSPLHVPCPHCGAMSGNVCRDPKGKVRLPPHAARLKKFAAYLAAKQGPI